MFSLSSQFQSKLSTCCGRHSFVLILLEKGMRVGVGRGVADGRGEVLCSLARPITVKVALGLLACMPVFALDAALQRQAMTRFASVHLHRRRVALLRLVD